MGISQRVFLGISHTHGSLTYTQYGLIVLVLIPSTLPLGFKYLSIPYCMRVICFYVAKHQVAMVKLFLLNLIIPLEVSLGLEIFTSNFKKNLD